MKEMLMFFGDSTVLGVGSNSSGWPDLGGHYLKSRFYQECLGDFILYNLGVDGDNSEKLLRRLEKELVARLRDGYRLTVFIAIGLNDSQYDSAENKLRVSPRQLGINLGEMLSICRKYSAEAVFVTPVPVDESRTNPIPHHPERSYRNSLLLNYVEEIEKFGKYNNAQILNFYRTLTSKADYASPHNSYDGLHPSDMGYHILASIFVDFFEPQLLDRTKGR